MSFSDTIPPNSTDLIHELDERFPLHNPRPTDSLAEIQRAAGRRDVVEFLLSRLRQLEDNILE